MESTSEVRWGIVGAGNVCEHKGGPPLYQLEGCRLVGVTRRDPAKGQDYARRHGPSRYFESLDALLAEPALDAVYVATPPTCHAEHTAAAARAGRHVLCEKPMAMNAAECRAMVDVCAESRVVLAVAYYRRCYPSILRARELVTQGAIGPLERVRLNDEFPASHRLDLVHFFCGDILSVRARVERLAPGSHAEEGPVLYAETTSGAEAVTNIGWHETGAPETVELEGRDGRVVVDDLKGGSLSWTHAGEEHRETFAPLPATHWGIVANFRGHLLHGAPLACDGEEGRKSSVVLDVVSTLDADDRPVAVDYDNPPDPNQARGSMFGLLA
jgi:predicted dehydrogenase